MFCNQLECVLKLKKQTNHNSNLAQIKELLNKMNEETNEPFDQTSPPKTTTTTNKQNTEQINPWLSANLVCRPCCVEFSCSNIG